MLRGDDHEKFLDQRSRLRHFGGQASKLGRGVLLAFEYEAVTNDSQMQLVSRREPKGAAYLCGNDESSLLPKH